MYPVYVDLFNFTSKNLQSVKQIPCGNLWVSFTQWGTDLSLSPLVSIFIKCVRP